MKTLTVRQVAAIKRVAQNVNPLVVKKHKIAAKINELNAEYNALNEEIEGHEMGVRALTGGLMSEDLIVKKVEDTGKFDKDGKSIKATKYEPSNMLVFNPELNVYEIREVDTNLESVTEAMVDDTEVVSQVETTTYSPIDNF